jgi:hypothetical protein
MNLFTFRLLGLAIFTFSSVAFIAEATSHEHIHNAPHDHKREITAENSVFPRAATGTTQLFNASDLSMLSSGCANALAGTLACSDLIVRFSDYPSSKPLNSCERVCAKL